MSDYSNPGDLAVIQSALRERGLVVKGEEGPACRTYLDPDGREIFFDTSPEEAVRYEEGHATTIPFGEGDVHDGEGLDLGNLTCCLACADLTVLKLAKRETEFEDVRGIAVTGSEHLDVQATFSGARMLYPPAALGPST